MVQDAKKLRPGIVGGVPGKYALMSEECGVDEAVPQPRQDRRFLAHEIRHGDHQARRQRAGYNGTSCKQAQTRT